MGVTSTFRPKIIPNGPYGAPCYNVDLSGWDYIVIQCASGQCTIGLSNDGGAVEGAVQDSPLTAINFVSDAYGKNLATGILGAIPKIEAGEMFKIELLSRYLYIDPTPDDSDIILMLYKKM